MMHPVAELPHQNHGGEQRLPTTKAVENSCLMDLTNFLSSGIVGRDGLRKSRASGTLAEHSLRVYTIAENVKTQKTPQGL